MCLASFSQNRLQFRFRFYSRLASGLNKLPKKPKRSLFSRPKKLIMKSSVLTSSKKKQRELNSLALLWNLEKLLLTVSLHRELILLNR